MDHQLAGVVPLPEHVLHEGHSGRLPGQTRQYGACQHSYCLGFLKWARYRHDLWRLFVSFTSYGFTNVGFLVSPELRISRTADLRICSSLDPRSFYFLLLGPV